MECHVNKILIYTNYLTPWNIHIYVDTLFFTLYNWRAQCKAYSSLISKSRKDRVPKDLLKSGSRYWCIYCQIKEQCWDMVFFKVCLAEVEDLFFFKDHEGVLLLVLSGDKYMCATRDWVNWWRPDVNSGNVTSHSSRSNNIVSWLVDGGLGTFSCDWWISRLRWFVTCLWCVLAVH